MQPNLPDHVLLRSSGNRAEADKTVALEDAEDDDLACGAPTALSGAMAAERCLIEFHEAIERLS